MYATDRQTSDAHIIAPSILGGGGMWRSQSYGRIFASWTSLLFIVLVGRNFVYVICKLKQKKTIFCLKKPSIITSPAVANASAHPDYRKPTFWHTMLWVAIPIGNSLRTQCPLEVQSTSGEWGIFAWSLLACFGIISRCDNDKWAIFVSNIFNASFFHRKSDAQLADMHCQLADDKDLIIGTSASCLWSDAPMCPCHLKRHCNHLICWGDWKCECETVENAILENARHENDKAKGKCEKWK